MRVSAVVPTLNEAAVIVELVGHLEEECAEVIVVDGGSDDDTVERARGAGARVVADATRGRGPQLNRGAALATGEALVFIHADTRIPAGFGEAIVHALDGGAVGGNFRLRFEPRSVAADLFTLANDLRRRALSIYYGDSCLFVRREHFETLGGFVDTPLFEDYAFVRRLERSGPTAYVTDPVVVSSARRFQARPLSTLALWGALQAAYSLGASPRHLARLYKVVR